MRFEVFPAVKMWIMIFWVVTLCSLVGCYQHFGERIAFIFTIEVPEDGTVTFLRNVDNRLQVCMA
jgi:hypothetical protein